MRRARRGEPVWVRLAGTGVEGAWSEADVLLGQELADDVVKPTSVWEDKARRLARQRLKPLIPHLAATDELPEVRRLIVLPSTDLAWAPVEAFASAYVVSYASSATTFVRLAEKRAQAADGGAARPLTLLALGDPQFASPGGAAPDAARSGEPFRPLPGTRREVEALAQLFRARDATAQITILMGNEATAASLNKLLAVEHPAAYRFLHLATHGVRDARLLLQSALILASTHDPARPEANNQRLTAAQILETWKLDADLVTLSACQTALGRQANGEGYLGFAQALTLVGVRSVVLSLWPVSDTATALLMVRFYENLLGPTPLAPLGRGQQSSPLAPLGRGSQTSPLAPLGRGVGGEGRPLPKADALREAKHWLRNLTRKEIDALAKDPDATRGLRIELPAGASPGAGPDDKPFAHPFYWSAFILIGDPE